MFVVVINVGKNGALAHETIAPSQLQNVSHAFSCGRTVDKHSIKIIFRIMITLRQKLRLIRNLIHLAMNAELAIALSLTMSGLLGCTQKIYCLAPARYIAQ